jgi:hypothetical protein
MAEPVRIKATPLALYSNYKGIALMFESFSMCKARPSVHAIG